MEGLKVLLGKLPAILLFASLGAIASIYIVVKIIIFLINHIKFI